ncbi:5'/3'-nucleotidase SurE [Streptomyces sp. MS1.HAVA.3]|uniref:5'-nucleotidase n=1 Tax=Streptomyces caledonius TaxID=3134107 RepID=A0ABU8UDC3_9ACTN
MRRKRVLPLAALMLCTPALAGTAPAVASPQTAPSAAPATAPAGPLRILLTNDDGYNAPGIRKAFERLTAAGHDVTIVAPLTNQSGTGTKMMNAPTITVKHPEPKVWAVDGTPGDSVAFGLSEVFADRAPTWSSPAPTSARTSPLSPPTPVRSAAPSPRWSPAYRPSR